MDQNSSRSAERQGPHSDPYPREHLPCLHRIFALHPGTDASLKAFSATATRSHISPRVISYLDAQSITKISTVHAHDDTLDLLIAVQPGVTVRASARLAQRKAGVWSGARAVKQSRRGDVPAPASALPT
jgi:hypothetical protein